MPDEMEVKIAVASRAAAGRAIRAAGGGFLGSLLQTDRFFDTPERHLYRGDRGVRIRTVRRVRGAGAGGEIDVRPLVTFKGPRSDHGPLKRRAEFQTRVEDAEALVRIFEACGLRLTLTIQKRRTSYGLGRCLVELDELPGIGHFVEVEGPDAASIQAVLDKLRLPGEPVTETYAHLLAAHFGGLEVGAEVLFAARRRGGGR